MAWENSYGKNGRVIFQIVNVLPGLKGEMEMNKFKDGDVVRWFFNPTDYITGTVVEVCGDGKYLVEHSNGQKRHYMESELMLHTEDLE